MVRNVQFVCFKKYISKLNLNQDSLWQRPKQSVSENDSTWYCNVPHGEKHLGSMLSHMSLKYNLSQRYTNHSLRVTSLQTLADAKIEGRHIIRVSGHKSVSSLENYARKLSTSRKRSISAVLSERVENIQNKQQSESVPTSIASLLLRISQFLRRPLQMTYQIIFLLVYQQNCLQEVVCRLPQYFITAPNIHFHIHTEKYRYQQ